SWTGARPVSGGSLMVLSGLWLLGRVVNWFSALLPGVLVASVDVIFFPVLVALVIRALVAGWSVRNFIFLPVMAGLCVANVLIHLEWLGVTESTAQIGQRLAIDLVILLITILGGRVIPAFTTNALRKKGDEKLPLQSVALTKLALLSVVAMTVADLVAPQSQLAGMLAATAALVNFIRMSSWRLHRILDQPIVWVLFMGFGFIILGLAVQSISILGGAIERNVADHLLMIGGAGGMTVAVMSRAALGHTGRVLHAPWPIIGTYVLIGISALIRASAPVFFMDHYIMLISVAGSLWALAFVLFSWVFWPILTTPRPR
ncbi:MAG: NnrS family protein, partial [Rhodospirillales bacterium]|nr:NnrS family protein [Rhodospirillales bacterium]